MLARFRSLLAMATSGADSYVKIWGLFRNCAVLSIFIIYVYRFVRFLFSEFSLL